MANGDPRSTKELFRKWRAGDAEAGQVMAQRFADWFYAIATTRHGELAGREPCERACQKFGEGIAGVTESNALVGWAHGIIEEELKPLGNPVNDGDWVSAYTAKQKPKVLLAHARNQLEQEIHLLEACYSGTFDDEQLSVLAQPLGGMPLGVLRARYRVKQWLQEKNGLPFEVTPDQPNMDRAPLPLYESHRMANQDEVVNFERWMVTDLELCRDIAEFAHFAIALRGGLPEARPPAADDLSQANFDDLDIKSASPTNDADDFSDLADYQDKSTSMTPILLVVAALGIFLVIAVLAAIILFFILL
jgi:hypothetical protein